MKNVQISDLSGAELEALSQALARPKKRIVEQLIHYAKVSKLDPEDVKSLPPSQEIKKTRQELIAFIKTQERDILKPLHKSITTVLAKFIQNMEKLGGQLPDRQQVNRLYQEQRQLSQDLGNRLENNAEQLGRERERAKIKKALTQYISSIEGASRSKRKEMDEELRKYVEKL